jgi:acetoacetyl-CoA synthetase
MAVEIYDDQGASVIEENGELVCTKSFPSMPIYFWNDTKNEKYHAAYFERYNGIWCQGDFAMITRSGGMVIHGRSDTVLNPGGVRIGTADIYSQVEKFDQVIESVVIGQNWDYDVRIILFLVLRDDEILTVKLKEKICDVIRKNTTPKHVPSKIIQVKEIPRTRSGKIVELAVKKAVQGEIIDNTSAIANPECLEYFKNLIELEEGK